MSLILDLLFPRSCAGCGHSGQYLCSHCRQQITFRSINKGDRLSLFHYRGPVKKLIHNLKFDFVSDLVPELTDYISSNLLSRYPNLIKYWQENKFVLVPVPLHPRRYNWRGFNQSELICQQLSTKLNLKYDSNILIRTKNTLPQTSIKNKLLRKSNLTSSFDFKPSFPKRGARRVGDLNIILFDDVYTTGSTVRSAISAFKDSSKTWILTLA